MQKLCRSSSVTGDILSKSLLNTGHSLSPCFRLPRVPTACSLLGCLAFYQAPNQQSVLTTTREPRNHEPKQALPLLSRSSQAIYHIDGHLIKGGKRNDRTGGRPRTVGVPRELHHPVQFPPPPTWLSPFPQQNPQPSTIPSHWHMTLNMAGPMLKFLEHWHPFSFEFRQLVGESQKFNHS